MTLDHADLLDRFCRYVRIDTRSQPERDTTPSTPGQWDLLRLLRDELQELGASEVTLTEHGYVLATLPPTLPGYTGPTMAWFAHVDTEPNLPGAAKPLVHRAYDGRPIILPDDPTQVLRLEDTPHLREAIGEDIVTASGTTLLGADDKAGVAAIMAAVRHLLRHPEIPRGRIRVCFNPDEEVAAGMSRLDLAQLGADFGYTLDAADRGEINYETFSADAATVEIEGVASHPGWAYGVMVNAIRLASRFVASLPAEVSPERTRERDGFVHPTEITGNLERATVRMILRDFELDGLAAKRAIVESCAAALRAAEPRAKVRVAFREQYRNMRYWLEKDMRPVELLVSALRETGLEPVFDAIRGGTDGSNLTARGVPTPNLFCGMHEIHSRREWVSLQDMGRAAAVLLVLAQKLR